MPTAPTVALPAVAEFVVAAPVALTDAQNVPTGAVTFARNAALGVALTVTLTAALVARLDLGLAGCCCVEWLR